MVLDEHGHSLARDGLTCGDLVGRVPAGTALPRYGPGMDFYSALGRLSGWVPQAAPQEGSVFHYTTAEGLHGVVSEHQLRAGDAAGLNDTGEVSDGQNRLAAALKKYSSGELREFVDWALDDTYGVRKPPPVFVLSTSAVGDDANQWRLYADDGRGYVIELGAGLDDQLAVVRRPDAPAENRTITRVGGIKFEDISLEEVSTVVSWTAVAYSDADVAALAKELLALLGGAFHAAQPEDGDSQLFYETEAAVARAARSIKGPGFVGEREIRMTAHYEQGDRHAHYRAGRYGITRYVNLGRPDQPGEAGRASGRLPIRSVTLGPAHHPTLSVDAVQGLLARFGYDDVPVRHSKVSLR